MKNYSKQREEILEVLKKLKIHPTAEQVYNILKSQGSTASKSTVYRNLNLLVSEDIIKKVSTVNGPERYDYIKTAHNHVICTKCGKVYDFDYDFKTDEIEKQIKCQTDIDASLYNITIQGVCSSCKIPN